MFNLVLCVWTVVLVIMLLKSATVEERHDGILRLNWYYNVRNFYCIGWVIGLGFWLSIWWWYQFQWDCWPQFCSVPSNSIVWCWFWLWQVVNNGRLKIALIGQSQFAVEVYKLLQQKHDIVGVFTIPDVNGRSDPLGLYITNQLSFARKTAASQYSQHGRGAGVLGRGTVEQRAPEAKMLQSELWCQIVGHFVVYFCSSVF